MIKRLLTIYLPAVVVLATATLAAVFLFKEADPELDNVEFVTAENTEIEERNRITENAEEDVERAEELRITNNELWEDTVTTEQVAATETIDRSDARTAAIQPTVIIISGPGVSIRCELNLVSANTAHQVMQQAAHQCGFSYQTTQHASLGTFVEGLGGVVSDKKTGLYWIYSVNGDKANVGVSSYQLQPGDTLSWNYEQEY
ncbi:MAG: hypothetical protein ACD_41C00025G0005 [uncultured bacterium]|nr:MAG: hypothetical protein ACD_41C00025G0005 [uncultured bacterium]HBY73679.1 hypothetical protein [Candidatus Kerfeldbacteria bacterium]